MFYNNFFPKFCIQEFQVTRLVLNFITTLQLTLIISLVGMKVGRGLHETLQWAPKSYAELEIWINLGGKEVREHGHYELEYESMRYISLHAWGTTDNLLWLKFGGRWGRRRIMAQDEAEKKGKGQITRHLTYQMKSLDFLLISKRAGGGWY